MAYVWGVRAVLTFVELCKNPLRITDRRTLPQGSELQTDGLFYYDFLFKSGHHDALLVRPN